MPWLRSLLMPSNPNAMPTSGTSSAANATVVTPPTLCDPTTNRARNRAGEPATWGAELLMSVEMKYSGTIAAIATTISSTKNRTLPRWSAISLAAIVRQPPGRRALGAAGGARRVGAA